MTQARCLDLYQHFVVPGRVQFQLFNHQWPGFIVGAGGADGLQYGGADFHGCSPCSDRAVVGQSADSDASLRPCETAPRSIRQVASTRSAEWVSSDSAMSTVSPSPRRSAMTDDSRRASTGATPSKGSSSRII